MKILSYLIFIVLITANNYAGDSLLYVKSGSYGGKDIKNIALSPDGMNYAIRINNQIKIHDVESGNLTKILYSEISGNEEIIFDANSEHIINIGEYPLAIWSIEDLSIDRELKLYEGNREFVVLHATAISNDNKILAAGGYWKDSPGSEIIAISDYMTGEIIKVIDNSPSEGILLSPDNNFLFSSYGGRIKKWDLTTYKKIEEYYFSENVFENLIISKDGSYVAGISRKFIDGDARFFVSVLNANNLELINEFECSTRLAMPLSALHPETNYIAYPAGNGIVNISNVATGELIKEIKTSIINYPEYLTFTNNGKSLIITQGKDGLTEKIDFNTGELENYMLTNVDNIKQMTFSPNNQLLGKFRDFDFLEIVDVKTGNTLHKIESPLGKYGRNINFGSIRFSNDNQLLALTSKDSSFFIWDFFDESETKVLKGHVNTVLDCAFSPNSDMIASGSLDKSIKVWDRKTGKIKYALKNYNRELRKLTVLHHF